MSAAVRITATALAMTLAAAAGYWLAARQQAVAPSSQAEAVAAAPALGTERKPLYYRNPMGLPDTSPVPKKDSMGMDYIPVYADEQPDDSGAVLVSPARIQTLGVKTAAAELRRLDASVRASGRIEIDERSQVVVAPRFEGWIERLYVNAVGDPIKKGQPLFSTYSPELQSAGEELRIAERLANLSAEHDPLASEAARRLAEATHARLRNLQMAGQSGARQVFHAPVGGVVLEKAAIQGARFMPGDVLFRIADLSKVWVIAEIHEQNLAQLQIGQQAQLALDAWPGHSFGARVSYLYPTLEASTRSLRIRLEVDNAEGLLRPGMFVQLSLMMGDPSPKLAVPSSALIDDGQRQVVLIALGQGRFKPQPVRIGQRGREWVEVLEGVEAGDQVVVSANFLIDSESQLKAALTTLHDDHAPQASPAVYETEGRFEAYDAEQGSVTMTHGEIAALHWPAMTMDFVLADPALLKGIAPGTPVRFAFKAGQPGQYIITSIAALAGAPAQPGRQAHGGH